MTHHEDLTTLADSYPPGARDSLLALAQAYREGEERALLDLAGTAAEVSAENRLSNILEPDANPRLLEAFELQFPNVSLESLRGMSEDDLEGYVSGLKGKFFEVLVRDRLNDGESVGEITLQARQRALLADSPTQPGWDLKIVDQGGETVEALQLKATENIYYIKEHLERYPDIRVVTPKEIDGLPEEILQTNILHDELAEGAREHLEELGESGWENLVETGAASALDFLPVLSVVVVLATEGHAMLMGRTTLEQTLRRGGQRLAMAGAYSVVVSVAGHAAPLVLPLRFVEGRITARVTLSRLLESKIEELKLIAERV